METWGLLHRFDNECDDNHVINAPLWSVGRKDCSLNISSTAISSKHCAFEIEDGKPYVVDYR